LFNASWRMLWVGSLGLAALSGFYYGWSQRSENPPLEITRKAEEPPETKLLKKGRYDEAVKAALESIKDENTAFLKYDSVAAIYAVRAVKDPSNREKWLGEASRYTDKIVNLAHADSINFLGAAYSTERIGDISSQSCPYYEKARQYAQSGISKLNGDCMFVGDERVPTQPIRDDFEKLLSRLQSKMEAKCMQKP
jgi:hypothetical protein